MNEATDALTVPSCSGRLVETSRKPHCSRILRFGVDMGGTLCKIVTFNWEKGDEDTSNSKLIRTNLEDDVSR